MNVESNMGNPRGAQPSRPIDREAVAAAEPMATQTLGLLEKHLGGQPFFCGADYSDRER